MVIVVLILLAVLLFACIKIVPQQHIFVIERFGKYHQLCDAGLNFIIPLVDFKRLDVNMKEQVADFPPQPVITKDNVTMQIDTVVYFQVTDPKLYCYGVENPIRAIENLTATTLRNIIGDMELDQTLTSRDSVNGQLCSILDTATDPWGIKINRVELKNIMPPRAIQEAMEKQMKAEREKREQILIAEGDKQTAILNAQAEQESAKLKAEAQYISMTREAEAHAEAIRLHQQAQVDAIRMYEDAGFTTEQVVKLKSLEAYKEVGQGASTKIIIPSDIQNVAGLVESIKNV